jgi:hypothetical protein
MAVLHVFILGQTYGTLQAFIFIGLEFCVTNYPF